MRLGKGKFEIKLPNGKLLKFENTSYEKFPICFFDKEMPLLDEDFKISTIGHYYMVANITHVEVTSSFLCIRVEGVNFIKYHYIKDNGATVTLKIK